MALQTTLTHDLQFHPPVPRNPRHVVYKLSGVATVGPDQLEPSERHGQDIEQQLRPIPVLHVRRGHFQGEDVALRVYQ